MQVPSYRLRALSSTSLDMFSKEVLESAINRYEGTCIYISHDRYFINKTAEKILELTPDGVILYNGNYDYYLTECQTADTTKTVNSNFNRHDDFLQIILNLGYT